MKTFWVLAGLYLTNIVVGAIWQSTWTFAFGVVASLAVGGYVLYREFRAA